MIKQFLDSIFKANEKGFEIGDLGDPSSFDKKKNEDDSFLENHQKFMIALRKFQFHDFSDVSKKDIKTLTIKLFKRLLQSDRLYSNINYFLREIWELRKLALSNDQIHSEIDRLLNQEDLRRLRHRELESRFAWIYAAFKLEDGDVFISRILNKI